MPAQTVGQNASPQQLQNLYDAVDSYGWKRATIPFIYKQSGYRWHPPIDSTLVLEKSLIPRKTISEINEGHEVRVKPKKSTFYFLTKSNGDIIGYAIELMRKELISYYQSTEKESNAPTSAKDILKHESKEQGILKMIGERTDRRDIKSSEAKSLASIVRTEMNRYYD